jgi:ribosome maturation factor RimP
MTLGRKPGDYRGGPIGSVHFFFAMTHDTTKVLSRVTELAAPFVESLGLALWGIEIAGGAGRPVLRVFIDGPDGVDVEQCARVSRQLDLALDMEDLVHGAYSLEVSSPGLDRRFFEFAQLVPYAGSELDVTLTVPLGGRKRFKGRIAALADGIVVLDCEGQEYSFAFSSLAKARLCYHFDTPEEMKAKARSKGRKTSKADKDAPRPDGADQA